MFARKILATSCWRPRRNAVTSHLVSRRNTAFAPAGTSAPAGSTEKSSAKVSSGTRQPQGPLESLIPKNPLNQQLVDLFTQIANQEIQISPRHMRQRQTFKKLISKVCATKVHITTVAQLYGLYIGSNANIGLPLLDKLSEIAESDKFPFDPAELKLVSSLARLPGTGPYRIRQIVDAGCKSAHDLTQPKYQRYLTLQQKIGIEYREHLGQNTSLEAANAVLDFCKQNTPSSYQWVLVGDHRRGVVSPVLRLIVAHPDHVYVPLPPPPSSLPKSHVAESYVPSFDGPGYIAKVERPWTPLQATIIPMLMSRGLITVTSKRLHKAWHGVARLPGLNEQEWQVVPDRIQAIKNKEGEFRWLKIHAVPQKSLGAALIHFTGDSEVLKWLKISSLKKGLHLNDYGLWRWAGREPKSGSTSTGDHIFSDNGHWEMLQAYTEKEIFEQIGVDFVPPNHRNFCDWVPHTRPNNHHKKSFVGPFVEY